MPKSNIGSGLIHLMLPFIFDFDLVLISFFFWFFLLILFISSSPSQHLCSLHLQCCLCWNKSVLVHLLQSRYFLSSLLHCLRTSLTSLSFLFTFPFFSPSPLSSPSRSENPSPAKALNHFLQGNRISERTGPSWQPAKRHEAWNAPIFAAAPTSGNCVRTEMRPSGEQV